MSPLRAADFDAFFGALYRDGEKQPLEPFPWQRRLVRRVLGEGTKAPGGWPRVLALPTASGKTAAIDVAVFTLACQADLPPAERVAPRRIFFVVDRRVIVDEAHERARRLAEALAGAEDGILAAVAGRLRHLAGSAEPPLATFELRGGIYRDDAWARTPLQPVVIASTVDQIGSRLLYRGYGVSSKSWPIHAGLAAHDALVILDEAHCSRPFIETLEAVEAYRRWADSPLPGPFATVAMTATPRPGTAEGDVFRLGKEDRAHPELGRRLRAGKPAALLPEVPGKTGSPRFVKALCEQAERFAGGGARRIAVLVNRVDTARKVREALDRRLGERVLMIGRMRPWDRDRLLTRWRKHLAAGPGREPHERPIFVAATQCLEVGADLDFDALVTECASLDALRQRFGRLNRLGSETAPQAAVAAAAGDLRADRDDFVYGPALRETWQWLTERGEAGEPGGSGRVDFGIDALDAVWLEAVGPEAGAESRLRERLAPPAPAAPVLLPAHLDLWAQTAPAPMPDPDVGVFLHGAERSAPEVQVCWRLDLDPEDAQELDREALLASWAATVALLPPTSAECMPVPRRVVVRWLRGEDRPGEDLVDLEGAADPAEGSAAAADSPLRTVLTWRGPEESAIADRARPPRPGDTVVIPAALGGWDDFGHIPVGPGDRIVADVAEPTNFHRRRRAVLRLHPAVLSWWPAGPGRETLDELAGWDEAATEEEDLEKRVRERLAELPAASRPEELQDVLRELSTQRFDLLSHPSGRGWVLRGRRRVPVEATAPWRHATEPELYTTDDDSASALAGEVLLADHCRSVAELARRFGRSCGVPDPVADDLGLAGRLHDLGKADPRFQAWLHGGNAVAAQLAPLRAKSSGLPQGLRERERARRRAGYPRGGRHELLSVRLVESAPSLVAEARDPDLVLHLVAAHHGHCRPFAPVIHDGGPVEVVLAEAGHPLAVGSATGLERLDSGVAERFWRLVRRYGWWGLAYLETILRLADHRQSEAEDVEPQRAGTPPREVRA